MKSLKSLAPTLVVLGFTVVATAQIPQNPQFPPVIQDSTRLTIGGGFMFAQPKENFRANAGDGYGAGGGATYNLDRAGWFSLRLDFAGFQYGHEEREVPLSPTIGGRILVDVNTSNSLASIAFGPEFQVPRGPVRPYVGFAPSRLFFWTSSSIDGVRSDTDTITSTKNYSDATGAWVFGTGVRIPFSVRRSAVDLDMGLRYHRGGNVAYLWEGSIQDNPDGTITITPFISRAPFLVYSVGLRFRIPYKSSNPCPRFLC